MTRKFGLLSFITGCVSLAALVVIYAPLLTVWVFSFWKPIRVEGSLRLADFSWDSYQKLTENSEILETLRLTLTVGAISTVLAIVLSLVFSLFYWRTRGIARKAMQAIILLPFLLPPIIVGLSLLISFNEIYVRRGVLTIIIGHTVLVIPVVYKIVLNRLESINESYIQASFDLGASKFQTLVYVVIPQLGLAVTSGALLSFAISFDETLVTVFLSGSSSTLPIRLWSMMRLGFVPEINALASSIVCVAALATLLFWLVKKRVEARPRV